jgi:hypothetical protein
MSRHVHDDLLLADDGPSPGLRRAPRLPPALDFDTLRLQGIAEIERLGRAHWTDYNTHDPGITLLEAMAFAITDLGYRAGFAMSDLLAPPPGQAPPAPDQGPLFSAATILPGGATTALDLRKVALDVPGVRNAWVRPAARPNVPFYPDRAASVLAHAPPATQPATPAVAVRGVWDVALELGRDPVAGDLSDNSVPFRVAVGPGQTLPFDVVFPPWFDWRTSDAPAERHLELDDPWSTGAAVGATARNAGHDGKALVLDLVVSATTPAGRVDKTMEVRIHHRADPALAATHQAALLAALADLTLPRHPVHVYRTRLARALAITGDVRAALERQRPLCEAFHEPSGARFLEIGVCADVQVNPAADIEALAARLFAFIDGLWSPPVRFRTLGERLREGTPVEEIFEGPRLRSGFLSDDDLRASEPPDAVHASDVIQGIMNLDGVEAVRTLSLTSYRDDGTIGVEGAPWEIPLDGQLPRFSADKSRIVFYKDGIPFHPRPEELAHKMALFAARDGGRPLGVAQDLDPPPGRHRRLDEYRSLREDLPRLYGVGRDGLPPDASPARRAQAQQLIAFSLLFDQLLANGLTQLAHLRDLFSLAPGPLPTFFAAPLAANAELAPLFSEGPGWLQGPDGQDRLAEPPDRQRERRNRILDHLLARFDEDFAAYGAVIADLGGPDDPAAAKARFLAEYPRLSRGRGQGADLADPGKVWTVDNVSGLERRLLRLLGIQPGPTRALAAQPEPREGLHLVEHLLLRPELEGLPGDPAARDRLMSVTLEGECSTCTEHTDPYSFRATLVLPAGAGRFRNTAFRNFVERTARLEAPAHVFLKICWVDDESLARFETAYAAFLTEHARQPMDLQRHSARKRTLIEVLESLRSVYPAATLHDCYEDAGDNPVRLGFGRLGNAEGK